MTHLSLSSLSLSFVFSPIDKHDHGEGAIRRVHGQEGKELLREVMVAWTGGRSPRMGFARRGFGWERGGSNGEGKEGQRGGASWFDGEGWVALPEDHRAGRGTRGQAKGARLRHSSGGEGN